MTAAVQPDHLSTREVCRRTGVTYRRLDYWLRCGVDIGHHPVRGSGSLRSFTDDDVRVVEFLRDVASLIPEGGTGVKRTVLLAAVARCLTADRSLLDEELVYIAFDGSVHLTPVTGWCLVRSTSPP